MSDKKTIDEIRARRERALAELRDVHTPGLDAMRADLPHINTSDLIAWICHPEGIISRVAGPVISMERTKMVASAAMAAIGEEIDRRIPTRETTTTELPGDGEHA